MERLVAHERDALVGPGPERGAGQAQPPLGRLERLGRRLAPRQAVAGVVDLVEDDQRAARLDPSAVQHGLLRHLGVGGDVTVDVGPDRPDRVGQVRVERDPGGGGRLGPLGAQVIGRAHHDDPVDDPRPAIKPSRDGQREGRLAGTGSGMQQVIDGLLGGRR